MEDQTTPPYIVGVQYFDNKVVEKKFLNLAIANDTMRSLASLALRYPNTIKNVWIR